MPHEVPPLKATVVCGILVAAVSLALSGTSTATGASRMTTLDVQPDNGSVTVPDSTLNNMVTFTVYNTGSQAWEDFVSCYGDWIVVVRCSTESQLSVPANSSETIDVYFESGPPGSGHVKLRTYNPTDIGTYNVTAQ